MPIDVACPCGRNSRVKDEFAGKRAKCSACGNIITIPVPEIFSEDLAAAALLQDDEPSQASAPRTTPIREADSSPPAAYGLQNAAPAPKIPPPRKKINIEYREISNSERRRPLISLSPGVVGALGLILLGVIITGIFLAANRISIYGVALIFIGLFRFVAGLFGASEE